MRQFDFSPLYRATVGFDQIADMFDRVLTSDTQTSSYPPYNIEKIDEDAYRISVAVAGFSEADLNVEVRENSLIISAGKTDEKQRITYIEVLQPAVLSVVFSWPITYMLMGQTIQMGCFI